jgi:hypothetical protein
VIHAENDRNADSISKWLRNCWGSRLRRFGLIQGIIRFNFTLSPFPLLWPCRSPGHSRQLYANSESFSHRLAMHLTASGKLAIRHNHISCAKFLTVALAHRQFVLSTYPTLKQHNPDLPILIREAQGTPARAFARFGSSSTRFCHVA